MKWIVLSDNRTNDPALETEHGLSVLLQTEKHNILLDTGASDVFMRNAERLGVDLAHVDYVFIPMDTMITLAACATSWNRTRGLRSFSRLTR